MNKAVKVLKWAAAVAAALAAGSASATSYSFVSGSLTVTESDDAASIGGIANWVQSVPVGSTTTLSLSSTPNSDGYYVTSFSQVLTGGTFVPYSDPGSNDSLSKIVAAGSALTIARGTNYSTFSNIEIDIANHQLLADVTTQSATYGRQKLFDLTGYGGTQTTLADGSLSLHLTGSLELAAPAPKQTYAPWFTNVIPTGIGTPTSAFLFGSLSADVVATPVPEPSTHALMGLGLVAVGAMARRRAVAA